MAPRPKKTAKTKGIAFEYLKSTQFRVIHADGAHGGPTPSGTGIHMSFFSERLPIPQREVYDYDIKTMQLGKMKERTQRSAVIREAEVGVIMSVATAKKLRKFLDEVLTKIDGLSQAPDQKK